MKVKRKIAPLFNTSKDKYTPSEEFCFKCKNKDAREMQKTINKLFGAMKLLAPHLNLDDDDWEKMCSKFEHYAHQKDRVSISKSMKRRKNGNNGEAEGEDS